MRTMVTNCDFKSKINELDEELSTGSIIIMSGYSKNEYYPLGRRTNVIGRDEALPIQVLDPMVSRKHLRIRFDNIGWRYKAYDMGSKHGVFVNGKRIYGETVLYEGDQIRIGRTSMLFTLQEFPNKQSALNHFKKVGERMRETYCLS